MNLHFVMVLPSLKAGGGNRCMVDLANNLKLRQYDVTIVVPNCAGVSRYQLTEGITLVKGGLASARRIPKLLNMIWAVLWARRHATNSIIVLTDPMMGVMSPLLRGKTVYRYMQIDDFCVYDGRDDMKGKFVIWLYKVLARDSYRMKSVEFIFNSRWTYNAFAKVSGRTDVPFRQVVPAIDLACFYNHSTRRNDEINICLVGRPQPWKGLREFIAAWQKLDAGVKRSVNNVFIVSEDDLSGFDISEFELVKPANDEEIAKVYNRSHIFVSTSWWEGFGLPPLEAMACGCAVLLTDSQGIVEWVQADQDCVLYEAKNIEQLKVRLEEMIKDQGLRARLAENAEKTARVFTGKRTVEQLLNAVVQY